MAKVRPLRREDTVLSPEQQRQLLGLDTPAARGNLALLAALDADRPLVFRGQRYRVPPVSCLDGWALHAELEAFDRLTRGPGAAGTLEAVRDGFVRIVELMIPLATPERPAPRPPWWRRALAKMGLVRLPVTPHPFYDASVQEVAELVSFFSARTRTSTVRSSSPTMASARARSMSPRASANWH